MTVIYMGYFMRYDNDSDIYMGYFMRYDNDSDIYGIFYEV